jgi:hypothetical protein
VSIRPQSRRVLPPERRRERCSLMSPTLTTPRPGGHHLAIFVQNH